MRLLENTIEFIWLNTSFREISCICMCLHVQMVLLPWLFETALHFLLCSKQMNEGLANFILIKQNSYWSKVIPLLRSRQRLANWNMGIFSNESSGIIVYLAFDWPSSCSVCMHVSFRHSTKCNWQNEDCFERNLTKCTKQIFHFIFQVPVRILVKAN